MARSVHADRIPVTAFYAEERTPVIEGRRPILTGAHNNAVAYNARRKNVEQACRFYGPILELLGFRLKFAEADWAGWQPPTGERPLFIVTQPFDGEKPSAGNGQMIAFMADRRDVVDRCHALALDLGGIDAGRPGIRAQYHPNYYGAYFRDPDGNKLCVCCHSPG